MSHDRFFLFSAVLIAGLIVFAPPARPAPVLQATYSEEALHTGEVVTVEAAFSWPREDGPYYFFPPEWELENLIYAGRSRTEDSFAGAGGRLWQRVTFRYEFRPARDGKARIGFIRFAYLQGPTQETGTVTVVRQLEYQVRQKDDYLLMLTDMLCLMSGMLFAASLLILFHTRNVVRKTLRDQKTRDAREFAAVPEKIEKAQGEQKSLAFQWGEQFRRFLIYRYGLSKTILTERETVLVIGQNPNVPAEDARKVRELFDRLETAKFSNQEWEEVPFERLKNDLLDFIRRKNLPGAP